MTPIVAAAVALHMRCAAIADASAVSATTPVRRDLRVISAALVGVTCLMLAAGTVVTGTGPLAGDAGVARFRPEVDEAAGRLSERQRDLGHDVRHAVDAPGGYSGPRQSWTEAFQRRVRRRFSVGDVTRNQ